jgi:hypothetical protein
MTAKQIFAALTENANKTHNHEIWWEEFRRINKMLWDHVVGHPRKHSEVMRLLREWDYTK